MLGHFLPNGRQVLWDIPERPTIPAYRNISFDDPHDGIYLFGQNIFPTRSITITSLAHRNFTGNAEEFILGALSVLLIALLSEIVQAILLCTRRARRSARPARKGVKMAFLIDEFYHFRNVWSHVFGRLVKKNKAPSDPDKRRRVATSVTILLIALGLMAADVFAVYLTQPISVSSKNFQYNIRGVTPTFANIGLGRFVKRLSVERPCVTPTFVQEGQERLYTVSACTTIDRERQHGDNLNYTGPVTVSSFFHKAGADHNITFGKGDTISRFTIKSRTIIYVSEGPAWRVLYDVIDNDELELTKFAHELFMINVVEVSCNRRKASGKGFENTWCDEVEERRKKANQSTVKRQVVFWSRRDGTKEEEEVDGVETTYQVELERVWESIDSGISALMSTSQLLEVEDRGGQYVNITNERQLDNLDGLLQEEGRVAGLMILGTALLLFAISLIGLRFLLRPVSLGAIAWDARRKLDDSLYEEESDRKEGGAREASSEAMSSSTVLNFDEGDEMNGDETDRHHNSGNNIDSWEPERV